MSSTHDNTRLLQLVAAMARNDADALSALYHLTVEHLVGVARGLTSDRAEIEEIVCDSYVYAWHTARQFDPHCSSVITWLVIICRNRALNRLRETQERRMAETD